MIFKNFVLIFTAWGYLVQNNRARGNKLLRVRERVQKPGSGTKAGTRATAEWEPLSPTCRRNFRRLIPGAVNADFLRSMLVGKTNFVSEVEF